MADFTFQTERYDTLPSDYARACETDAIEDSAEYGELSIEGSDRTRLYTFHSGLDAYALDINRTLKGPHRKVTTVTRWNLHHYSSARDRACHLNDDGIPDLVSFLNDDDGVFVLKSVMKTADPFGSGLIDTVFGVNGAASFFDETQGSNCSLTYSIDYYAQLSDLPSDLREAYQQIGEGERGYIGKEERGLRVSNYHFGELSSQIHILLQNRDKKLDNRGNKLEFYIRYSLSPPNPGARSNKDFFIHHYAVDWTMDNHTFSQAKFIDLDNEASFFESPHIVAQLEQGGYLAFSPIEPSQDDQDERTNNVCLVDHTPPFLAETAVEPLALKLPTSVVQNPDGSLAIPDKVLFDSGRSELRPDSDPVMQTVEQVIAAIQMHKDQKITEIKIEAHTDSEGDPQDNQKLSMDRALSVKFALVGLGIDGSLLTPVGHGESRPEARNDTPEGRQKNRRVEFTILTEQQTFTLQVGDADTSSQIPLSDMKWEIDGTPLEEEK